MPWGTRNRGHRVHEYGDFGAIAEVLFHLDSTKIIYTSFRLFLHPPFEPANKTPYKTTSFVDDIGITVVFRISYLCLDKTHNSFILVYLNRICDLSI